MNGGGSSPQPARSFSGRDYLQTAVFRTKEKKKKHTHTDAFAHQHTPFVATNRLALSETTRLVQLLQTKANEGTVVHQKNATFVTIHISTPFPSPPPS